MPCLSTAALTLTLLCLCGLAAADSTTSDAYVNSYLNTTLPVSAVWQFADHSANVVFATNYVDVYKLNGTSLDVLDSASNGLDRNRLRRELYSSKGWLFVWSGSTLTKLNASDLSTFIATLNIREIYRYGINNVVVDEARQLAYAVSNLSNMLVIIDMANMNVTAHFNFTSNYNTYGYTGADSMVYDALRKVLWISVNCVNGVPSYMWQIDMRTATAPSLITTTPFGGKTCFYSDPVIDYMGTSMVWFSDDGTNNVIGVDTEGKWNYEHLLPFPVYTTWSTIDTVCKQGFYLSGNYNDNSYHCLDGGLEAYWRALAEQRWNIPSSSLP